MTDERYALSTADGVCSCSRCPHARAALAAAAAAAEGPWGDPAKLPIPPWTRSSDPKPGAVRAPERDDRLSSSRTTTSRWWMRRRSCRGRLDLRAQGEGRPGSDHGRGHAHRRDRGSGRRLPGSQRLESLGASVEIGIGSDGQGAASMSVLSAGHRRRAAHPGRSAPPARVPRGQDRPGQEAGEDLRSLRATTSR